MTRKRWIQIAGELIPEDELDDIPSAGYYIQGDIAPYRSMADGKIVEGRRQHREMLKANNCYEVGNETQHLKPKSPPPGLKQRLIEVVNSKL